MRNRGTAAVDVRPLRLYAADRVPVLARSTGHAQYPQVIQTTYRGGPARLQTASFDIGELKPEDQAQIALAHPKPLILRPVLLNPEEVGDSLKLTDLLAARLRSSAEGSSRGGGEATVVYVPAEQMSGAIQPKGSYTVKAGAVSVTLALWRDGKKVRENISVTGHADNLRDLAARMSGAIIEAIGKL